MNDEDKKDVMQKLAFVCTAAELQLGGQPRDFRRQLVREEHYKALIRTMCGLVYTGLAQALTKDKEEAKALLKEVRDAATSPAAA